ncbi:AraC family transcriptional regulator [Pusillimonas caeni]|uniref:AraC family transcriptional regulator n=1 Tax=Pusillimonas caeni TaxID=1348472 RepID=UPI000E59C77C|nr:AraC family transcriptional regulator [Pusillimonas caeni]TFL09346.1 AraC family transcriptional regulator [Pusillimonas caeni]
MNLPSFPARRDAFPLRLFHSHDLDETRSTVGRVFKPHDLGVLGRRQKLDAFMDHLPLGRASINRLCYGADVSIEPDCLGDFLLVQMPMQGSAVIRCGDQQITSGPHNASVITPSLPLHMRWQGRCDQLIVRLERAALEAACSAQLGHALSRPIEFQLGMDLSSRQGAAWKSLVQFLASSSFTGDAAGNALVGQQVEQLLVTTLLTQHPHSYSEALSRPVQAPPRHYVQRAEDYILARYAEPITIETLARHAAISARSLHKGFQQHKGMSPMGFLRLVRLQRVRERLLQASAHAEPVSITRVALEAGFSHLGHFTQAYRRQFGETPTQTATRRAN